MSATGRRSVLEADGGARLAAQLTRLRGAADHRRRLRESETPDTLFSAAAELACEAYGFERATIGVFGPRGLGADASPALQAASEQLRQRLLQAPVSVQPAVIGSEIRAASEQPLAARPSVAVLAGHLALAQYALGVIAPERRTLALLIVDRSSTPVDAVERAAIELFADGVAAAVESLELRARLAALAGHLGVLSAAVSGSGAGAATPSQPSEPHRPAGGWQSADAALPLRGTG